MAENSRFCANCGKPVSGNMPLMPVQSRIAGHVRLLGILWLALSGILLLGGAVMMSMFRARGLWDRGFPPGAPPFVHDLLSFLGVLLLCGGLLGGFAGWGLLDRQAWARTLTIVLACFALVIFIPFGTFLGIYTLWVLLPAKAEEEYRQISRPAA